MNNFKKIILNNGIPLYLYSNKSFKQVFVSYVIKYGSNGKWFNFELDGKKYNLGSGYAHYLEHLLGEHSKHGNIYSNFDNRNYDANAGTAHDRTMYHFCGKDNIKKSIKELIEAIECPVFDSKDVNKTRHAIEEEAASKQDRADIRAVNLVEQNLYSGYDRYDYTLSSIGNRVTTKKITTDNLYVCYDAFYTDDNKALIIFGNVDEKEIVDYLNELYSGINKHKSRVILPKIDYDPIRKEYEEIRRKVKVDINSLAVKIKKPDDVTREELFFCIDFLHDYLLSDENDFYSYLKSKDYLDTLQYHYTEWNEPYIEFINSYISNNPKDYCSALIDKVYKKDMTPEEFELIKKCSIAEEVRDLDDRYEVPYNFAYKLDYTDDCSAINFLKNFTYERYMEILNKLDFTKHTVGKIRMLKK